jgi:two-component system, NtrC family, sensor kinase
MKKNSNDIKNESNLEYVQDNSSRYKKLFRITVILTCIVAVAPLITMAIVNIYQYQKAFKADIIYPLSNQTTNIRNTLESFIEERYAALKFISKEKSFNDLSDINDLSAVLRHLKESFDGYIDLGIINSKGSQISYIGPYNLLGKDYSQQQWFNEAVIKGDYISDVFMG